MPKALALRPDLVSILMGANDLVRWSADVPRLAEGLEGAVRGLVEGAGCDVMLVTPFLPDRIGAAPLAGRFRRFGDEVCAIAQRAGAVLRDVADGPDIRSRSWWAADCVHLSSAGHRLLAYRAAAALGVPDAETLGGLDAALHDETEPPVRGSWLLRDAVPWVWRRARSRTAGDGMLAEHDG